MLDLFPSTFIYPPKLHHGEKVAILSPSSGLPGLFPGVYEQGLQRLREIFHLQPVEYPTTRKMRASPEERAHDIHAAFADPEIKAVISSIGGDDQIKVLKYLDPEILKAHPKAFFGFSDNTNLLNFLWNLGIVSYHGGAIMTQFGRSGSMHPYTLHSLQQAFFEHSEYEIHPSSSYTDEDLRWDDPTSLHLEPTLFPNDGWTWQQADDTLVEGTLWGGNMEILDWNLRANKYILPPEAYSGKILFFETSEELPSATEVYRILMCMGERGLLQQFAALLVGRPKAWSFEHPFTTEEKAKFTSQQVEAVRRALSEYHPDLPVVFNLDIGHTDPQCILPNGGHIKINGKARRIVLTY